MSSAAGVNHAKILALSDYQDSDYFSDDEKAALAYADRITFSDQDVDDACFEQLRRYFSEEAIIELTALIAWENASSKFNRALRVPSQKLWDQRSGDS